MDEDRPSHSSTIESLRIALENGLLGDALDIPSLVRVRAVSTSTRRAHDLGRSMAWRKAMQSGENVLGEAPDPDGFRLGWWRRAVDLGGAQVVTALLEAADERARDLIMEPTALHNNTSCLRQAALNGDLEMVDALLRFAGKLGADALRQLLLMPNYCGENPLHVSASRGHLHIVKALLGAGGRELAMTTDDFGESCLGAAAREGHLEIVRALLQAHPELLMLETDSRRSCLYTSARNGNLEIVRALLQAGGRALAMTTDNFGESCLGAAAREGHLEIVRALLQAHPELLMLTMDSGCSCLHSAATRGHLQVVKCLLQAAGPLRRDLCMLANNQGRSCLHLAVKSAPLDFVAEVLPTLLEAGGPEMLTLRDVRGDNCLRIAVERGNPFISNMLAAAAGPEGRTELDELFCKAQAQFLKDFG
jgi:ankyrin repeat protein